MATTDSIKIDPGTTTALPTYDITEDAITKEIPRSALNDSTGAEIGVAAKPIQISLANTGANATAVKVDGSAVTQPVSGTVTANAGTNLNTSALALDATLTGGTTKVQGNTGAAGADSGNSLKTGAVYNTTRPTYTTGQRTDSQSDSRGSIGVNLFTQDTGQSIVGLADNTDSVAVSSLARALDVINRNTVFNGTTWDRQYGDATNGTWVNVKSTVAPVIAAGTNLIGKVGIDQTTPGTTNFVAANLTQINGTAISGANPLPTTQYTTTGNGFTPSHYISAASTNATNIKASAGDIGGIQAYNNTGTIGYLKIYDKASSPTVGTDVPVKTILIPANTSGAGTNISFASPGISCSSGISFAITGGIADADTAAVAANAFVVNFDTK